MSDFKQPTRPSQQPAAAEAGLPPPTQTIQVLQIGAEDALDTILEVLRQQRHPTVLLMPTQTPLWQQQGTYVSLQALLKEHGHLAPLVLVIPPSGVQEHTLAMRFALPYAQTLEEAWRMLESPAIASPGPGTSAASPADPSPTVPPADPVVPASVIGKRLPVSSGLSVRSTSLRPPSARRHQLVGLGLLLGVTLIVLPLLFMPLPTPSATASSPTVGTLTFSSSGQLDPLGTTGLNDILTLSVHDLPSPASREVETAWLVPDPPGTSAPPSTAGPVKPLLLGTLHAEHGDASLTYTDAAHRDLLASYSGVGIGIQEMTTPLASPSETTHWLEEGWIPHIPTPGDEQGYSLLSHLRHLLAADPDVQSIGLSGGLGLWLLRNSEKLVEYAAAARDSWAGTATSTGTTEQIHRQIVRILQYLDGQSFVVQDVPADTPWLIDTQAGHFGLLERIPGQNPPAYLTHIGIHLIGVMQAPGHSSEQQQLAITIMRALTTVQGLFEQMRQEARQVVGMTDAQLRQQQVLALLDELATQATTALDGQFASSLGGNIDGVAWIDAQLQRLAVISLQKEPAAT
jgi:hypothetical protein